MEGPSITLAQLDESATAYQRARQLHDSVGEHLRHIDQLTERHLSVAPTVGHRRLPPDVAHVVSLFRSPRTARQAMVASIILGPARGLQE
jgi:hypothetical protein